MINVYSSDTTTFNNNGQATLTPLSCELSLGINGAWQLTMEHALNDSRTNYLVKDAILRVTDLDCVSEWETGQQMFRIYDTEKTLSSITVIAFPLGMEAQYDAPIEYIKLGTSEGTTGAQAAQMLDTYVKQHDGVNKYTISSNITRKNYEAEYENTNLITAISGSNGFVHEEDGWGGEVVYDNYKIKIQDRIGARDSNNPYPIRYGRNLVGLTHEVDCSNTITRLYPISSDGLRLNDYTDTSYTPTDPAYVDADNISSYPFIRASFWKLSLKLTDTTKDSTEPTALLTAAVQDDIIDKTTDSASDLWDTVCHDLTNTYCAAYLKTLINGKDDDWGIVQYLQSKFSFSHANYQSIVKSCVKTGVAWIKSEDVPTWEWHEDTSVIPHAWWYGDASTTPSTSYAKNCYIKIGKEFYYFNDDGYWEAYKNASNMYWYQSKTNGKWWYGDRERYYAHNEFVYMTVSGVMKEWWYDEEGWYDADSSGDSDFDWHWSETDQAYWFGEEGASADDKSKYLHDCWRFIDGTYYWFDEYGYTDADPAHSMPNYQWGNQVDEVTGKEWYGNTDKNFAAIYIKSQWMKIDNAWYYFDSDGWLVDMDQKKADTIAWFANSVYADIESDVIDDLKKLYDYLYTTMTSWCEAEFAYGLCQPTINVSVDLIDLSKTSEYAEYKDLERVHLGDNVKVIGKDGTAYSERVVGLTYDCIRGYNSKVEVGELSKTVSQTISVNFKGSSSGDKLIAGDNVVIDGQVISVGDYTGTVIGLQDAILNGSSIVSGNVAEFGIEAGSYITLTRSGNVLTINGERGGNKVFYGSTVPSPDLGENGDCYLRIVSGSISQTYYKVEGTWSIEPTGGLTYWVEDTNKIYRHVSNSVSPWDCDSAYKKGQFQITNPNDNYIVKKNNNVACCATYSFEEDGQKRTFPMIISTEELDTIVHHWGVHDMGGKSFTVNGITLYYSECTYNAMWGDCTISGDVPPYLGDFTDKYHEFNDNSFLTQAYVRDYLIEVSNFHTTAVNYSGIGGNNSDFVAWGGDYYSVGDENPTPDDMPFFVRKNGEVNGSAFKVNGKSVQLDTLVDGTSVVGDDGIGRIALASVYATKTELAAKQDTLIAGTNITIDSDGKTINATDTTYSAFDGATSQASGTSGLVPAPSSGDQDKVLCGDGTWKPQSGGLTPVEIEWSQYQQLTPEQQVDPTINYYVKNCPDDNYLTIVDGKLCIVYDNGQ